MIEYDDLKQIQDEWGSDNRSDWWLLQGVNPEAVTKLCLGESLEDVTKTFPQIAKLVGVTAAVGSCVAAAYEIGMQYGVRLEQKVRANGHH